MAAPMACATVLDADGRHDVAVPVGTTIAGLAAMLHMDVSGGAVRLTLTDGSPAEAHGVIGADIPSGVVLSVSGERASVLAARRAAALADAPRVRLLLVDSLILGPLLLTVLLLVLAPLAGWWTVPGWARAAAGACAGGASLALLGAPAFRDQPARSLAASTTLALSALCLLPLDSELTPWLLLPVAASAAFAGCMAWWVFTRTATTAALAVVWATASAVGMTSAWTATPLSLLAPAALAFSVLALTAAPSMALSVPQSQLLDLPLVTTSAAQVRAPRVPPPARVTAPRVDRTLREATRRNDVVVLALCVLAAAATPSTVSLMGISTWPQRSAIILVVCAAAALAVIPRQRSSRLARLVPRACAVLLLVTAVRSPVVSDAVGQLASIQALLVAAILIVAGTSLVTHGEGSALAGRAADIVESLSVTAVLPAATVATGVVDLVRQAAS